VHVPPAPAVRVVLEEQVVFAAVVDEPVRVVRPAAPRAEVDLRPQGLAVERALPLQLVALLDGTEPLRSGRQLPDSNGQRLPGPCGYVERRPPVRLSVGQLDVELRLRPVVEEERHLPLRSAGLY